MKRSPFEVPAGRQVETDRLSKGISEDFRPPEPERVASDSWERQPCAPATSFTSRAQRTPIQFILVSGSVPLRCAPRTLGVLSIQPPPRKLRCVPFSGPLGFLSGAVAYTPEDETGLAHSGKSYHGDPFTFLWIGYDRTSTPAPE